MSRVIGCNSLHLAEVTKDDATGATWAKPVAVPSLISFSVSDQKENVTFYSDDTIEQVIPAFSGKEVTIELGYLTPEIEAMISGNTYENGVYIQKSDAVSKEYACLLKAPLSKGGERFVCLFKGVLAKNETEYKGKGESIESSNVTLTGVFMPLIFNGQVEMKVDSTDTNLVSETKALIENGQWFKEVPQMPTVSQVEKSTQIGKVEKK